MTDETPDERKTQTLVRLALALQFEAGLLGEGAQKVSGDESIRVDGRLLARKPVEPQPQRE